MGITNEEVNSHKAQIAEFFKKKKGNKSYYRIAEDSGLTIQQLHHIENQKSITIDSLIRVARAMKCKFIIG